MKNKFNKLFYLLVTASILLLSSCITQKNINTQANLEEKIFTFDVAADMRDYANPEYQTSEYFLGVCQSISKVGKGEFMVSPGDIDPPDQVAKTIQKVLGENYFWYPVLGNHEVETEDDMEYLKKYLSRDIPNLVNNGPSNSFNTMYSFDFENSHFIVLNEYYDGISINALNGDIGDSTYKWLSEDLKQNQKPFIFVFGHEPIISMPDYNNGRMRHKGDNLDAYPENSFRFQQLLRKYNVTAYFCGHTHNFSYAKINGIWQIDAGHSRGKGDTGARSTFLQVHVNDNECNVDVYRSEENWIDYTLIKSFTLD